MGKRGKQNWSKTPLPVGAIKRRSRRRSSGRGAIEVRMIKVRADGPMCGRWIPLAKFTWEQAHGPVPPGMRVVHADGNSLNDDPSNYKLMTAGEVIKLHHDLDPVMSRENRQGHKRREAIAEHNRLRGRLRRAVGLLPSRWYIVDVGARIVFEEPYRSRRQAAAAVGVHLSLNGGSNRQLARLGLKFARGRILARVNAAAYKRMPLADRTAPPSPKAEVPCG